MNRVRGRTLHEPGGRNTNLQVFVTEEEKIERVGDTAPTIDSILIGEFTDYDPKPCESGFRRMRLRFSVKLRPEITHPGCKPLPYRNRTGADYGSWMDALRNE